MLTKTVYSLYFPETRAVVDALWSERPHHLYERSYTKRQDQMHGPFLARWRDWVAAAGVALGDGYASEYPTSGASEGIQALLARIATSATAPRIHVFDGEYEGYLHLAHALGLQTLVHVRDRERWTESIASSARSGDWFFVSQPSAIDGCLWRDFPDFVSWMAERLPGISLAVDLTYVGSVARQVAIDLRPPNVAAVLASLSKPFGVYYHRIGALLSREPLPSLYGNLWFKNLFSLVLGERLMAAHSARDLPARYAALQRAAVARAIERGLMPAGACPADVVLLAYARAPLEPELDPRFSDFVRAREPRAHVLRFCLTPALDAMIEESRP